MAANYQNDINSLIAAARCATQCFSEEEVLAIELYVRSMELAGVAGQPDYTGKAGVAKLVQDAKAWNSQVLNCATRQSVALYIDVQNAATVNPALDTGAGSSNTMKAASTCFQCIPYEQKKNYLLYLKWRLNKLGDSE